MDELDAIDRLAPDRFIVYFSYGKSHSRLNAPPPEMPEGIKLSK